MEILVMPWNIVDMYLISGVVSIRVVLRCRRLPAETRAVGYDIKRNCRIFRKFGLIVDEEADEAHANDKWSEDLNRIPRETNTTPGEADDCKSGASDDNEITTTYTNQQAWI
jgi:hypothetical protein